MLSIITYRKKMERYIFPIFLTVVFLCWKNLLAANKEKETGM